MTVAASDETLDSGAALRVGEAVRALHAGGVIAYPTEGVYGLGCLPSDRKALERLLRIKRRSWRKGLPLIAADLEQLAAFVTLPDHALREEILASWPGPVTWVLPAVPEMPPLLTGGRGTLAVRVTGHPLARTLCRQAGSPLISTSANRAGQQPLLTARAVRRALGADLDYVLAGVLGGLDGPTTIRDGTTGTYLRGGRGLTPPSALQIDRWAAHGHVVRSLQLHLSLGNIWNLSHASPCAALQVSTGPNPGREPQ